MQRMILMVALAALSACAQRQTPTVLMAVPDDEPVVTGWQSIVTSGDSARLADLSATWRGALAAAAPRYQRQIGSEGDLLVADAARNHAQPPPGSYHCRLVKLGAAAGREPPFRAFPEFFCYIRGEADGSLSFTKQTGSELPGGWLHPDGDRRLVLTGARQRKPGDNSLMYGADPERDLVGVIERVGPFRWRLVLPWRGDKPGLDVYELTPVPLEQQADEPRSPPLP